MKNMYILKNNNNVIFGNGEKTEILFNAEEYKDVLENLETDKYEYFKIIHEKYGIKNKDEIKNRFLYIFHFILIKNICNYIIDKYEAEKIDFLYFNKNIKNEKFKLSSELNTDDVLSNIIISLVNSEEYLGQNLKIDSNQLKENEIVKGEIEDKGIKFYFYYESLKKQELKFKIEKTLLEYAYIEEDKKNIDNRYTLAIYIDDEQLEKIGLENYQDYLINWISIAYLRMLIKIHDFLINYYNLTLEKGLKIDDVMLVFKPVPLTPELTLLLQGKDAYNIVPKI